MHTPGAICIPLGLELACGDQEGGGSVEVISNGRVGGQHLEPLRELADTVKRGEGEVMNCMDQWKLTSVTSNCI